MPRIDRAFLRFSRRVKKKYQRIADLVNTYGIGILDDIYGPGTARPWELVVGLAQNADRSELRQSHRVVIGIRGAFSTKLDKKMWEAICDTPEEVNEAIAEEQSILDAAKAVESYADAAGS